MRQLRVRDRHGASRAVAYLLLAAVPYTFCTGVVLPAAVTVPVAVAVSSVCAFAAIFAALCLWRPAAFPPQLWVAAPCVAAVLTCGVNLATGDASTAGQLFNLWPVIYAANFLGRRAVLVTLGFVYASEAAVVFTLLPLTSAAADFASIALAMAMIAVVVVPLRDRADHLRDELERQALTDPLTGLVNRRSFDRSLTAAVGTGHPVALLVVDVDHFKDVNDTYGHATGDLALQAVADALRSAAGPGDVAARIGGDEFVLLLRTGRPGAIQAAARIRTTLAATRVLDAGHLGVSIGVGLLPDHGSTAAGLLAAADSALYRAKSEGRGRDAVFAAAGLAVA